MSYWNLLSVICLSLLYGCTGNPFGDDKISAGKRQITGRVILNDGADPQGVYVWQKGYDLTTQTDAQGNFEIRLPPQPDQGTATGTIEQDILYFYLANYLLETALVMTLDGEFLYGRGDIDRDGNIRSPFVMQRFLEIITNVEPATVSENFPGTVSVETQLKADRNCATVGIPKLTEVNRRTDDGPLGAILVKKINSDEVFIVQPDSLANANLVLTVCSNPVIRDLSFDFSQLQLPSGEYEIIPYLFINPEGAPQRLLEIASRPFSSFDRSYLNKPIRWTSGKFEVKN